MLEEEVRKIVREELQLMLKSLAKGADYLDAPYDTGELESAALRAVGKVADYALHSLPHAADCGRRTDARYAECTCGID